MTPQLEQKINDDVSRSEGHGSYCGKLLISSGGRQSTWKFQFSKSNVFVKTYQTTSEDHFRAEAEGLRELLEASQSSHFLNSGICLDVPKVLSWSWVDGLAYLILEYFDIVDRGDDRSLGVCIAKLHQNTREQFGWKMNNNNGLTPQVNNPCDDWIDFYKSQRLLPMFELAAKRGLKMDGEQKLLDKLPSFFETYRPLPSLLHGDLWRGNVGFHSNGNPCIFDPATHFGDRECDCAMTELFGGFSSEFYAGYESIWPLDVGYARRRPLYQLYHILNHYVIFGEAYGEQAKRLVRELVK